MIDYCKYVDVFYGNGEVTEFPEEGVASKWFYIKALCGNTTPHAVLPFGEMSVGAYSGGYPTGYGTHFPNSCGGIKKLWNNQMKIRGFSHIHQSGTGAIDYYYNYAIATPFYGKVKEIESFREIKNEQAKPGLYSVELDDIKVQLTTTSSVAFHKYHFEKSDGRVAVDFSNDGLSREFEDKYHGYAKNITLVSKGNKAFFKGELEGVILYFCVKAEGKNVSSGLFSKNKETDKSELNIKRTSKNFGVVFDFDGNEIELKVAYSTIGFSEAERKVDSLTDSFELTAQKGYEKWSEYLSSIEIETEDEELKEKFYSNFYHSLIKPAVLTGENVLGVSGDTVVDFATFWDQYKTVLPLVYMLYENEGRKIADGIVNISETMKKIPCSFGLSDVFPCENQAKMLGIFALCDAYFSGLVSEEKLSECMKRELLRDDYKKFLKSGFFERYTHILDVSDACFDVAEITTDSELKNRLLTLSECWKNAYGNDGLMSENSPYYEGDRYTYSFRLQPNMQERIELAGGKESFVKMLDDFFGFGKESLKQITTTDNPRKKIAQTAYHRFEGFNNECDMETPFAYIFANRHDRLCEIVNAAVSDTFKTGTGGLPGNNDSGGLSSCFMWLVSGIFPWSGTGKMLIGCPQVDKAKIRLSNGKILEIETVRNNESDGIVKEVCFNSEPVRDYIISTKDIMSGGKLTFRF